MAQSPAITAAVNAAVGAVVDTAASNKNNIPSKSVEDAKPALKAAIHEAIAADPVVQNATNTEAFWWQKRSRWSMIISFVVVLFNPVLKKYGIAGVGPEWQEFAVTVLTTIGGLAAGGLALWAGTAKQPLFVGSKSPPNPVPYRG